MTHISTIGQKITKNYITLLSWYKKNQPGVFEESNPSDIIKSLIAKSPILRKIYTRVDVYSLGLLIKRIISLRQEKTDTDQLFIELARKMSDPDITRRIGPYKAFIGYIELMKKVYNINLTDRLEEANRLIPTERLSRLRVKVPHQ